METQLTKNKTVWDRLNDGFVSNIVTQGIKIEFLTEPPFITRASLPTSRPLAPHTLELFQELRQWGIVEDFRESHFYINHIFPVPKSNGKFRLILDLKQLNLSVKTPKFSLPTIKQILPSIYQDTWMCSLDLKNAYYHLPIHKEHRKYLVFRVDQKLFQFNVLPFGLTSAPYLFTRMLKPVVNRLNDQFQTVIVYLDDFLLLAKGCRIFQTRDHTLNFLANLGFIIGTKSQLCPSQEIIFLGVGINSRTLSTFLPKAKQQQIQSLAGTILASKTVSRRTLESMSGLLNWCAPVVPRAAPLLWTFIRLMNAKFSASHRDRLRPLPNGIRRVLIKIQRFNWDRSLSFCTREKTLIIYTDASDAGWGAQVGREQLQGLWNSDMQSLSINRRELEAIRLALFTTTQSLFKRHLLIHSDNLTAILCLRKKGSPRVQAITTLVSRIWEIVYKAQASVRFTFIPGNLNAIADALSRTKPVNSEWQLNPLIFKSLTELWFLPQIDLFATEENNQVPLFASPLPSDSLHNGLGINWAQWDKLYAFPPIALIPEVLLKFKNTPGKRELILVLPHWANKTWFKEASSWSNQLHSLPSEPQILSQRVQNRQVFHPRLRLYKLCALRCSKF